MRDKWHIVFCCENAEKEVTALPAKLKAKFLHVSELLIEFGPFNIGMPHIKALTDSVWEIRLSGHNQIARSLYVLMHNKKIVILHTFVKKTQKTPKTALKIAFQRLKEMENADKL